MAGTSNRESTNGTDGRHGETSEGEGEPGGHEAVRCASCGTVVGVAGPWQSTHGAGEGRALTLFKCRVRLGPCEVGEDGGKDGGKDGSDGGDDGNPFAGYTARNSFGHDVRLLSRALGCTHFRIRFRGGGTPLHLVVLNPHVATDTWHVMRSPRGKSVRASAVPGRGGAKVKVLYTLCPSGEGEGNGEGEGGGKDGGEATKGSAAGAAWADACGAEEMVIEWDLGASIVAGLHESTRALPPTHRSVGALCVGYLDLIEGRHDAIFEANTQRE